MSVPVITGDHKFVGDGVYELRLFFGSGYRVYFAEDGETIVLLLRDGDKSSGKRQNKNIQLARAYLADYLKDKDLEGDL